MLTDDSLIACLVEIERFVGDRGWDQPARLFALVRTDLLLSTEPGLADQIGSEHPEDHLSSVEQEDFVRGDDLLEALAHIAWPATVAGVALAVERMFLPTELESEIPDEPDLAARFVAEHPRRQEIRAVVGALRDGPRHGVARLRSNPIDLLGGADLVPRLASALAATLN